MNQYAISNEQVIRSFEGTYESDGVPHCNDQNKFSWFPAKGLKLKVVSIKITDQPGQAYAKVEQLNLDPASAAFKTIGKFQSAIFRVVGLDLVSGDIELQPGLLVRETLRMADGRDAKGDILRDSAGNPVRVMEHHLWFSDDVYGMWICWPKSSQ